jgi:hypothetical protein
MNGFATWGGAESEGELDSGHSCRCICILLRVYNLAICILTNEEIVNF